MPQPFNYSLNIPDPSQSVMQGIQNAVGIVGTLGQAKANNLALERKQQQAQDLDYLTKNPTAANFAKVSTRYPELSEGLKRSYDIMDTGRREAGISRGTQVYSALVANQPEVAQKVLTDAAEAARNSGDEHEAKVNEALAESIKINPKAALSIAGLHLAAAMGPDKFTDTFTKLEQERRDADKAPAELTEAQAKAHKAAVESNYAESNAVADLQRKGWDITKLQNDIQVDNQNVKIATLNAKLKKEENELKRQELQQKLDDAKLAREQTINEKSAAVESSRNTIDNSLNTIDRLLKNPAINDVVGPLEGRAGYPTTLMAINNPIGTSSEERANALADLDTIKSQTFLSQLVALKNASATGASGLGALSQQEGERLVNGVQSLQTTQGEKQFKKNLTEVQRLLLKMRTNVARKYGFPESVPDRPEAQTTPENSEIPVPSTGGFKVIGVER